MLRSVVLGFELTSKFWCMPITFPLTKENLIGKNRERKQTKALLLSGVETNYVL
jgi:hypothetical protein